MKKMLVLAGGGDGDAAVFATALAVAQPLGAHLEFCHVQVEPGEAAAWEPHAEFARGPMLREMMRRLRTESAMRAVGARRHFDKFCELHGVIISDQPRADGVSASWREETGDAPRRLMFRARHNDLVVLGRPAGPNGLPLHLLEELLLGSGRPLLIGAPQPSPELLGTVMVCWKETAEAARAVAAAMPLLTSSARVILAGVEEHDPSLHAGLAEVSLQLAWHGVSAVVEFMSSTASSASEMLMATARSHHADLLVMGGYGHSRIRETIFGGFTRAVLESADIAVFLMH